MQLETKPLAGKSVLVVEDECAVREMIRRLLANHACKVVEANNGAEAFSIFRGARFDLVMTDFEMPFVKGDELATKIKTLAPQQPILMLTAYDQRRGSYNPVDAVLRKPFDHSGLLQAMTRLLVQPGTPPPRFQEPQLSPAGLAAKTEVFCA